MGHKTCPQNSVSGLALCRPPEAVTRLSHIPSAEEFHTDWEKAGQPVVLEGLLNRTEVFRNWQQDDYLR